MLKSIVCKVESFVSNLSVSNKYATVPALKVQCALHTIYPACKPATQHTRNWLTDH